MVREIADAERRSQETIRTHLKSLYNKTNTSRQAELVRFAMRWAGRKWRRSSDIDTGTAGS